MDNFAKSLKNKDNAFSDENNFFATRFAHCSPNGSIRRSLTLTTSRVAGAAPLWASPIHPKAKGFALAPCKGFASLVLAMLAPSGLCVAPCDPLQLATPRSPRGRGSGNPNLASDLRRGLATHDLSVGRGRRLGRTEKGRGAPLSPSDDLT